MIALMLVLGLAQAADPEQGRATYVAKCQACHGPEGKGDGPAARALPKPPRDFTSAAFWKGQTDAKLGSTITQGKPGSAMRGFSMSEEQLASLVAYLRTLQPE
jgi:high-affinity iron transporter